MASTVSSFPATYSSYGTDKLLRAFVDGPQRLERAIDGLSTGELGAHPRPNKWSVGEIVRHLADAELMGACRIRVTLAQPGASYFAYDQDRWAQVLGYRHADMASLDSALRLFKLLRETTGQMLQAASPDQWLQSANHPERGPLTLRHLLEMYADHSERHIEQIAVLRSLLGRPLDLPSLLPERLF